MRIRLRRCWGVRGCLLLVMWGTASAQAQTVDYTKLETLFAEPVTTGATGKPQKASDVPVGLEIVTAEQIHRMGVISIPEVLARLPGVNNWQANRSFSSVGLRGKNSAFNPTLLVLINGRQVYVDTFGFIDWSLIPVQLEEIRQIEVIKGPATALYGFNAVSGVVNIITINPKYDTLNQVGASAGTGNYKRGYGMTSLKFSDAVSMRVSAGEEKFDEFGRHSKTDFDVNNPPFPNSESKKLFADGLIQVTDQTQLRMETSYADTNGVDDYGSYAGLPNKKSFLSGKISLASETSLGLMEMNLYDNVYHATTLGDPNENNTLVFQLQDLFKLGADDTFRLLGEYRDNQLEGAMVVGPNRAAIGYDVVSAGGVWSHAINPNLEWTNALRLDTLMLSRDGDFQQPSVFTNNDFDRSLLAYSYNSGIIWKAGDKNTFRVATGRGIQAPSLLSFGIDVPVPGGLRFLGNPDLPVTTLTNYEIGYDRAIAGTHGKFRSTVFYNQTKNLVTAIIPPGGIYQFQNTGDSATAGIELALNGTIGAAWIWDGSYTYQNAADDLIPATQGYLSATPLRYHDILPHHVIKAHLGYAQGPWTADLYGEADSHFTALSRADFTSYNSSALDGYTSLSAHVGYTFENDMTVALSGSDLAQARVANNYGLENERQVFISLEKKF